ncbi:MAG: cob(I)yrinic acid a,c-diamide adenosyltransferase [Acidiferrobacterales bacterium]|nr:cob(I)yrinic acid a,c-diamide adenosyltransferase [Acidiferrobacterales bacterium]
MGNRLSKIYTRTGDDGTTGLGDQSRVSKDSDRIEAIGQLDELNSFIGVTLANELPENVRSCLNRVQHTLLDIGGELAVPGFDALVTAENVKFLEDHLDALNNELAPLKEFILPGGTPAAAHCHVARTVCRRVERRLHTLANQEDVSQFSRQYVNRLSDLLFVAARYINLKSGDADVLWDHDRTKKKFKKVSS